MRMPTAWTLSGASGVVGKHIRPDACASSRRVAHRVQPRMPASAVDGRGRRAFTLFEVAISAALVATAVVTLSLLLPVGLRAQQQARFQLYAGCKVLEMLDTFANSDCTFTSQQIEGERNGQNMLPQQWPVDLERMMMRFQLGVLPLPNAIAYRLDSDGDEIGRLLADGGRLFYTSPLPYEVGYHQRAQGVSMPADEIALERVVPSEAQTLVFGVVGYAQQNVLPNHPCLAWPYSVFYPSGPATGNMYQFGGGHQQWCGPWDWYKYWVENHLGMSSTMQDNFRKMAEACPSWEYNSGLPSNVYTQDVQRILDYMAAAKAIVAELGIPMEGTAPYEVPVPPPDLTPFTTAWSPTNEDVYPPPLKIEAIRWLAAGALMRTGRYQRVNLAITPADEQWARDLFERCFLWTRRYASTNPYDWGAPRPLNRASAWDFPLLQYDLFKPHPVGDGTGDMTWKITAPRRPTNYARAYSAPLGGFRADNKAHIDASWATNGGAFDASQCNLTASFESAERCRQIAVWAVDWRAYEDFEEAVSGPYDASVACIDSRGNLVSSEVAQFPPDLSLAWTDSTRTARYQFPTGRDPNNAANVARRNDPAWRAQYFGVWGADRNGNEVFDRGPMPRSVRLRALHIGRWNFYDRRLVSSLRN
ncbi:MAG TPA: hypothetical protein VEL07_16065 [Planctomycetota bacterium]|nr:hypothetical protein [Planctomycetota bacterium]